MKITKDVVSVENFRAIKLINILFEIVRHQYCDHLALKGKLIFHWNAMFV